uniref:Uncharacterized protein n=1 Tax=Oryza glumipatula TaxID=40148 RepID=A0A0D9ZGM8_9ORYZ
MSRCSGCQRVDSSASASAAADVIRLEVGMTKGERSLFHINSVVLEAGPAGGPAAAWWRSPWTRYCSST